MEYEIIIRNTGQLFLDKYKDWKDIKKLLVYIPEPPEGCIRVSLEIDLGKEGFLAQYKTVDKMMYNPNKK